MAKKSGGGKKGLSQKLGTGSASGVTGMDLGSKLEKAATVDYRGYSQGPVKHGSHGVLAGRGGKKSTKVPQG